MCTVSDKLRHLIENYENREKLSPFEMHGALHVENGKLTDQHGDVVQLYGMSTHGIAWFPQYVNPDAFRTLRDDWNTNLIKHIVIINKSFCHLFKESNCLIFILIWITITQNVPIHNHIHS